MNTFFTSDHHFQHSNVVRYSNRPFRNVDEMDEEFVKRWNEVVKPTDVVYHLGDFTLGNLEIADEFLKRLNGSIYIMEGSHDRWLKPFSIKNMNPTPHVNFLPPLYSLNGMINSDNGYNLPIVLCHYSLRSWDRSHYGSWHLFGHHHGNLESY